MRITNANMKLAEKITGDSFESAKEYQEEAYKSAKKSWSDLDDDDDDDF